MKTVYLGLGSNLGDRERLLQKALDLLAAPELRLRRLSSVYETEPQEIASQPWFLNLVVEAETSLFPRQLLKHAQHIERLLGRQRNIPNGPRTIDIDLLLYGRFVIDTAELAVPHPRLVRRRFVLEPLVELAADLRHPVLRFSMRELLHTISGQVTRKSPFRPVLPSVK
jgi:2-amino-4-hydroxy-6-hydroxymethyldihydropteridine diphosphokinase